jgi:hypothetical protein
LYVRSGARDKCWDRTYLFNPGLGIPEKAHK